MRSGQLIEHNMGNFSFENSCTKCGGETILSPFLRKKNQNWAYLWVNNLILYTVCFYCMPKLQSTTITKVKLRCWSPAFTSYKAILKNRKRSGTNLFASFFTCYILLTEQSETADNMFSNWLLSSLRGHNAKVSWKFGHGSACSSLKIFINNYTSTIIIPW